MNSASAPAAQQTLRVAVVGNPNAGKTTLFNAVTGLRQKVANFPGVTVEMKTGTTMEQGRLIEWVDLPGTYSLAAHSPDEMVAVDYLLGLAPATPKPDVILAVVDASHLDRNLYLVSQLLELQTPIVLALNMMDVAKRNGMEIDIEALAKELHVAVVPTQAKHGIGIEAIKQAIATCHDLEQRRDPTDRCPSDPTIKQARERIRSEIGPALEVAWQRQVTDLELERALIDETGYAERRILEALGDLGETTLHGARQQLLESQTSPAPASVLETRQRYHWIRELTQRCVTRQDRMKSHPATERLDAFLTHKISGSLVFFAVMFLLFQSIFRWSGPMIDGIDTAFSRLGDLVRSVVPDGALQSLLADGVVGGVGAVVVFLPQILLLFLFIGILEDCGYMARAAFLMDRVLVFCGLSGKSFIPMLSGYACAVPAVMATRVIENRRDRLATILVTPLTTCSARLPVYTLLIATLIPAESMFGGWLGKQGLTLFSLYFLGIAAAVTMAWFFKRTILRGPTPPFVLELPNYQWPSWRSLALRLWDRSKAFLIRAGTIIMAVSILVWALSYFPHPQSIAEQFEQQRLETATTATVESQEALARAERAAYLEQSYFARMGRTVQPAFAPLGWDWRITMATLASFPAREVVIAVLGTIYSLGDDVDEESSALQAAIRRAQHRDGSIVYTIPVGLGILVFFALCCQCGATLATIQRETNSWAWPALTFVYMTTLAYGGAWAVKTLSEAWT